MHVSEPLVNTNLRSVDPHGGVLVHTTYWRPQQGAIYPEQPPGEKVFIQSYLPTSSKEVCRCGSGKHFEACCQSLPYWQPICPNPGMHQGYSLLISQSATFTDIPYDEAYDFLQEDVRLFCVEDTQQRTFWIYWGDPALDTRYGTICFGDIELKKNRTLLMTALSDIRMKTLLDLISPLNLGTPQIEREPIIRLEKPVRKPVRGKRQRKR